MTMRPRAGIYGSSAVSSPMAFVLGRRTIPGMYGNHMGDWWARMTIMPVLLIMVFAFAVYLAVRLGIRDGKHD